MRYVRMVAVSAFAFATALPSIANAAVSIGDSVTCSASGDLTCSTSSAIIGPGNEFTLDNGLQYIGVDFSSGSLVLRALRNGGFANAAFQLSDTTSAITAFSLGLNNGFSGLDANAITLNNGTLSFDLSGVDFRRNGSLELSLTAAATPGVPEPATWAMMLLGFGFVGGAMRAAKRRHKIAVLYA